MGTCDSCGTKGFFLKRRQCFICKDYLCYDCSPKPILSINGLRNYEVKGSFDLYICQKDGCTTELKSCFDDDWKQIIGTNIENLELIHTYFDQKVRDFVKNKAPEVFQSLNDQTSTAMIFSDEISYLASFPKNGLLKKMKTDFFIKGQNILAENLVLCGRPLDAAKIYEQMRNYDKARTLRENDKKIIIKKTNVSLNLNDLLKQIKDEGIVAIFRCPNCSGKLKIGKKTSMQSLRTCEYCGLEIESMELADFLTAVLS